MRNTCLQHCTIPRKLQQICLSTYVMRGTHLRTKRSRTVCWFNLVCRLQAANTWQTTVLANTKRTFCCTVKLHAWFVNMNHTETSILHTEIHLCLCKRPTNFDVCDEHSANHSCTICKHLPQTVSFASVCQP